MTSRICHAPKPHQAEAIAACSAGLKDPGTRGQCLMACGTGKTLVGYEVAREVGARTVLVLVPSLILVKQLAEVYRARGAGMILAVCSDSVKLAEDEIRVSLDELGCESTTDPGRVARFLGGAGRRFVVSTYQSQAVLAGPRFDLAIFDEAHRTAGKQGRPFSFALSDDNVSCARRLFMTATPRHAKLVDDGETAEVFSMNDPKAYGPVLYQLSMRAAIEAGIICDYKIIGAQVRDLPGRPREVAIRVALDKAMAKFGIRKGFTFHRRVQAAKDFITGATHTLTGVHLLHVNGQQTARERDDALDAFREAERALLTNARCLTEGVDLPDADMVAFLDNRKSTIDIVQAVGRASRKHESKANGAFVFLPVFVSQKDGEDLEAAVERSDFSNLFDVLQALREQDEVLASELRIPPDGVSARPREHVIFVPDECGEADQANAVAQLSLAVRARVLRAFGTMTMRVAKEEILRMVREQGKLPSAKSSDPVERSLGKRMHRYVNPKSGCYDSGFDREISTAAPHWFGSAL